MLKDISKTYPYNPKKDKGLMFFSAGAPRDCKTIINEGINELLVSYFYLKKRKDVFQGEILPELIDRKKGLFMTDSGGHSFLSETPKDEWYDPEYWVPYIEEYVQWLHDWSKYIYVAANMDLENLVGAKVVDEWNEKYFRPLEKVMNIVYVAHEDGYWNPDTDKFYLPDKRGYRRFKEYCENFDYVGVNNDLYKEARFFFQEAKLKCKRVHGFGWTSIPTLKQFPYFSADSTTWIGGVKYGTTYMHDGKNFRVIAYKQKFKRRLVKTFCDEHGVDFAKLLKDDPDTVNSFNLKNWIGARDIYIKSANLKLKTKPVLEYAK